MPTTIVGYQQTTTYNRPSPRPTPKMMADIEAQQKKKEAAAAAAAGSGTGDPAARPDPEQTIILIRDFEPGQIARIIFITPEQAKKLPTIPPDALQIAVAPSGGL